MIAEREMAHRARWTPQMVEERLAEAASVLGRLPPMRVYGYSGMWPRLLVDYSSIVCQRSGPLRLPPPDPAAVSRMEDTFGWSEWLQPVDSRIVWQRANGRRWKEICATVGLARAAAHEHWSYALCLIAWRLNGAPIPICTSRRKLIGDFRAKQMREDASNRESTFGVTRRKPHG